MSVLALIKANGPSGFGYGSSAEAVTSGLSLRGKTILLTGCNSGLGQETLRVLAMRGAHVIGTARTLEKAKAACAAALPEGAWHAYLVHRRKRVQSSAGTMRCQRCIAP